MKDLKSQEVQVSGEGKVTPWEVCLGTRWKAAPFMLHKLPSFIFDRSADSSHSRSWGVWSLPRDGELGAGCRGVQSQAGGMNLGSLAYLLWVLDHLIQVFPFCKIEVLALISQE